jgi:hypothetical protein
MRYGLLHIIAGLHFGLLFLSQRALLLLDSTHLRFKLSINTKVFLYSPLPSVDGDAFRVATGLALIQYMLLVIRYLRFPLSFCLLRFYFLILQQNI